MDLVRSVTKRVKRTDALDDRSGYARKQISMPLALLSTTNPLTNVCDLADIQKRRNEAEESITPSTPTRNSLDGDSSVSSPSAASTPATSIGEPSPDCEYAPGIDSFTDKTMSLLTQPNLAFDSPPCVPKRALSHSKRAHEQLARKRSLQFSHPSSDQSVKDLRNSSTSADSSRIALKATENGATGALGPFTRELEQLSEIAEQFGAAARSAVLQDDLEVLCTRGLLKFNANEYVREIQFLWDAAFCEESTEQDNIWI